MPPPMDQLTPPATPPATPRTAPEPRRWTDKFEKQALLNPSRTAVISGAGSMTYGELRSRSNQIANHLNSRGIGRGDFVGLGLHRSLELPAALLGIMKSGAAYVPLDPGYPESRNEQMISSAGLKHVITISDLKERFQNVGTICMDDDAVSSTDELDHCHVPDDLIYAIFTSGSPGQPKAASVYHRGFENLLQWYSIELELGPSDRTLIISSPSFDLTQKNFFAPLVTEGRLV
jgi:iturin family lipopeptide synthetase A